MGLRGIASVADLDPELIRSVVDRAAVLVEDDHRSQALQGASVGLLFLTPSLRTCVGFSVAAHRLGAQTVTVTSERGGSSMSVAESIGDTVRTMAGMVDLLVVRARGRIASHIGPGIPCPWVNGGDDIEHPTQALVDLAAIEAEAGPVRELRIAVVGDLGQRCVRSLVAMLEHRRPRHLVLSGPSRASRRNSVASPLGLS